MRRQGLRLGDAMAHAPHRRRQQREGLHRWRGAAQHHRFAIGCLDEFA